MSSAGVVDCSDSVRGTGVLTIDGSMGEGGGQVLRSSLSLSAILRRPIILNNIRGGREKPGLQKQHLVCVEAAAALCGAAVEGAALNSTRVVFTPAPAAEDGAADGAPRPQHFDFDIGSAGSSTLVLATVLPVLLARGSGGSCRVRGGTHNPLAPPFEFLRDILLPVLSRCGAHVDVVLERAGFYPQGGGAVLLNVAPGNAATFAPLDLVSPAPVTALIGRIIFAGSAALPAPHAAAKALGAAISAIAPGETGARPVAVAHVDALGAGLALQVLIERAGALTDVCTECGQMKGDNGKAIRALMSAVAVEMKSEAPVGEHLADQLLLPLALMRGGRYRATTASLHTTTSADVLGLFLGEGTVSVEHVVNSAAGGSAADGDGDGDGASRAKKARLGSDVIISVRDPRAAGL